ncbi:MAG TPA: amidohydrolase family protein [Planctomycetota bacterium]|nr:amidohydrolase family protein [Planctomycetota bacterium]
MTTPTIDAHQHFWQRGRFKDGWLDRPEHRPISASFLPADLAPLLRASGVQKSVFVQTQHDLEENRWVLGLAKEHDWIAGVVGWVDLESPRCEDQLLEFKDHPKFVGVRHIVQDEPDDDFIVRPAVLPGLKVLEKHGVPYDLLFFVKHLKHAATLAATFPDLRMVIDHLAKPRIKDHAMEGWKEAFVAAARFPNVFCKLSGMVTEADWKGWTPADLRPYVQLALESFGPDRLMFGSDWPVSLLAAPYGRVVDGLVEALGPITAAERGKIFGGTAARFYGLKV